MSLVALSGNASGTGTLTIAAPNTNSNYTLTLPTGTGTFTVNGVNSNIVSGTAVASTSGTSIDFTSLPTWVKRITVMFSGVSTSGTSPPQIQIGSGSVTTSGYLGSNSIIGSASVTSVLFTSGFGIGVNTSNWAAAMLVQGNIVLTLQTGNTWVCSGSVGRSDSASIFLTTGSLALGGALDRVRITTANGTDTFDAGSINILYE
jgi:hypothetical protein